MLEAATLLMTSFIESENRMKHLEYITSVQGGPTLPAISRWHEDLRELHERLRPHFARPQVHEHAVSYLQAVLSDMPRKNGWQIAEQAREAHPYGMQRLLSQAVWDQDGVRDEAACLVAQTLLLSGPQQQDQAPFPVLVLDAQRLSQTRTPLGGRGAPVLRTHRARGKLPGRRLPLLRHGSRSWADRPGSVSAPRLVL